MSNIPDPKQDQANAGGGDHQQGHPLDRYTVSPKGDDNDDKSPYYKPSAPVISMPKGGGALKGIDEKFEVNAVNGTSSLSVPLPLTPGRGGFNPSLSLSYNSGSGNSEFGLGWSLGLPAIQRKTDKKLPMYNDADESDVFVMAGAEDLVPLMYEDSGVWLRDTFNSGDYSIKRYRPRIEGLWARIEHITKIGTTGSWWKVTTKENVVTFYGLTPEARLSDPADSRRIFRWLPQVSYDNKGNVTVYGYVAENLINVKESPHEHNRLNGYAPLANTYLKRVQYCNRTHWQPATPDTYDISAELPATSDFLMEAVLDYGDHNGDTPTPTPSGLWPLRKDPFSDLHAGFEIRTYRRCQRVLMFHYFDELDGGNPVLVRSLDLTYRPDTTAFLEADFITAIGQTGYMLKPGGGYYSKSLPSITMDYQPLVWDHTVHNVSPGDSKNAPQGLTGPYQWIDLWGEGLPGILTEQGHGWFYKRNLGDGHFTPALTVAPKPSLQGLGSNLQWQDLDADGRRQVVSMEGPLQGFYELDDDQQWQSFRAFKHKINIDWKSPYTRMLDLDGDGRADVLITEDRVWKWYENEGKEGYMEGGYFSTGFDEEKAPRLLHNDMVQTIFLADMNGDGLTDIVRIKNREVCYWPNKGYGRFGAKVLMSNAPLFDRPDIFNPMYITLADVSGTGAPDLIYLGKNSCRVWINQSGNAFSEAYDIVPLPGIDPQSKVMVADFLGNGTACIVWSSPLPQYATAPMRYVDLMGGKKPFLMTTYRNGMGKSVTVQYKQSTKYYLEDRLAGKEWATKLPFPVHCVEKITTADSVSETQYTQLFSYHHGYYDHEEREFRGFGRVETIDTDKAVIDETTSLNQYPVLTKTWYHTGAWMRDRTLHEAFETEYYPTTWAELPKAPWLEDPLNPQEQREAFRALKGQPLRQEVYGMDGSSLAGVPYSVTTNAYAVKKIQPLLDNRYASFISYQRESLSWSAERNVADPRVAHQLTLEVDALGNVLRSATIAYPRVSIPVGTPAKVAEIQQKMLATYTVNHYTNDVTTGGYHLRVAYEAITYELTGISTTDPLWTCEALNTAIAGATEIAYTDTPSPVTAEIRTINHTRTLFEDNNCSGPLALGTIASLALPYTQYTLAFTDGILTHADYYDGRVTGAMLSVGGYLREDTIPGFGSIDMTKWWLPGGTQDTDTTHFYTQAAFYDPWGNATTITYWNNSGTNYYLLPHTTTDAVGNVTSVNAYNWYNLQPTRITDINNNEGHTLYDALGMPVAAAVMEKDGSSIGDTLAGIDPDDVTDLANQVAFFTDPESVAADLLKGATWRCVYDLYASPVAVGMIARERHFSELAVSPMLVNLTYTDGMGRIAMKKVQAAPAEGSTDVRWIGSGKVIYNNKGKEVMQYEPYFTDTPLFDLAEYAATHGVSPRLHYDALGRVFRTDMPDGTFAKTEWDAWLQKNYDANDTVDNSNWYAAAIIGTAEEQDAAAKAHEHYNTPTISHLDTLGREFFTVLHDRYPDPTTWTDHFYESYVELDITGNRIAIYDARGLMPQGYSYTQLNSIVRQVSMDSGTQHMLVDASGQPLYRWDADNRKFRYTYDVLRRQLIKEVTPSGGSAKVLEVTQYGEGVTDDTLHNLRGHMYKVYDGAGLQTIHDYDFKKKPLNAIRKYTTHHTTHPDWTTIASVAMETEEYTTATKYDALERLLTVTTPDTGVTSYEYERSGMLFKVRVDDVHSLDTDIVNEIYYNSKGQRLKTKYENGATTTYEYDVKTYRVTRIRTTRSSDSAVLQDLLYWYDPVGNITLQKDDAQQSVFYDNTVADPKNDYTYDALYRLIKCEGREHAGSNAAVSYNDSTRIGKNPLPTDASAMRRYAQYYKYDSVGNMLQMKHTTTGGTGNWTRNFDVATTSNKLLQSSIGSNGTGTESYTYDARGNMMDGMNHLLSMEYNHLNRLEKVELTATTTAYYQYDSNGQRVRKVLQNTTASQNHIRKYIGGWEVYQKIDASTNTVIWERETLHIYDQDKRIALIDTPTFDTLSTGEVQLLRYQYSNNISTASLELDDNAAVITYEEYYPYGNTSYQGGRNAAECSLKRYRYTGKERDEETGLNYHGARYYALWLARWISNDPMESKFAPQPPNTYCRNNPIVRHDPNGAEDEKSENRNAKRQVKAEANGNGWNGTKLGNIARDWLPGLVASLVGGIIDFVAGIGTILIGALTLNETKIKKGMHLAVGGLLSTVGLKEAFTEKWVPGPTGGKLPDSLSNDLEEVEQNVPKDAYKNGMHAWHAGSNAALANKLGPVGSIFVFLGGIFHESPLDWGSFKAEQHFQGTVNHILDSITDIIANVFGIILGLLLPKKLATKLAIKLGNHIPGPGDPDPAFGGDGAYRGNPTKAWGQYPRL
ncbi:MAG: FG-GAP-like repeat-containing protein [Taibaiella sp.]|nr:FG-GAP-like repeat-containing protein [Taibaiella sp.]